MTPCSTLSFNGRFGGTYHLHLQGWRNKFSKKKPASKQVETQRTTRRHIPQDDTLNNHRCENLKSYIYHLVSDRSGEVVITPASDARGSGFKSRRGDRMFWVFSCFSSVLQGRIKPQLIFSLLHNPLTDPRFYAEELSVARLHTLTINHSEVLLRCGWASQTAVQMLMINGE
jgi:hypothetical protein